MVAFTSKHTLLLPLVVMSFYALYAALECNKPLVDACHEADRCEERFGKEGKNSKCKTFPEDHDDNCANKLEECIEDCDDTKWSASKCSKACSGKGDSSHLWSGPTAGPYDFQCKCGADTHCEDPDFDAGGAAGSGAVRTFSTPAAVGAPAGLLLLLAGLRP